MCGRYSYSARQLARVARQLRIAPVSVDPCFNVAPMTKNPVVVQRPGAAPTMELYRWGLVPHWAKDEKGAARMINARCESVADKPAFRSAYRQRRCLVIADGFYEWAPAGKPKQPWRFTLRDPEAAMVLGGLWETWQPPDAAEPLHTYCLITTDANQTVSRIHDRMPVILAEGAWQSWLDPAAPLEAIAGLLRPWPEELTATPVTPRLNNVRFQGPECHRPEGQEELLLGLEPPRNSA